MPAPDRSSAGGRTTVVLVPGGPCGEELLAVVRAWTQARLLAPSMWVRIPETSFPSGAAPDVPVHVIRPTDEQTESLFQALGRRPRSMVRVVLAQILTDPGSFDEAALARAEDILTAVKESVPDLVRQDDGTYSGTRVLSLNLITGRTGLAAIPDTVLKPAWSFNVVTSPEDRRDPGRANEFVRYPGNLVPVAATSLASIAGLFTGVDQGPFDDWRGDASVASGRVVVIRPAVRALLGEGIVHDVAQRSVTLALDSGSPALTDRDHYTMVYDSAAMTADALAWLDAADHGALSFRPAPEAEAGARQRVSLTSGLAAFARFSGLALLEVPRTIYGALVRSAESAATAAIVGTESGLEITLRPSVGPALATEVAGFDERSRAMAARELERAKRLPVAGPTPALWSGVRALCFGLLDGGALPPGFETPMDGTRRVLLRRPDDVGPSPLDRYAVTPAAAAAIGLPPELQQIGACDPAAYQEVRSALDAALAGAQARLAQVNEAIAAQSGEADSPAETGAGSQEVPSPEGAADPAAGSPGPGLAELKRRRVELTDVVAVLAAESRLLDEWVGRRVDALLWQVTERVTVREKAATAEGKRLAASATAESTLDHERPAKLYRRFFRQFLAWFGLAVLGSWLIFAVLVSAIQRNQSLLGREIPGWPLEVAWFGLLAALLIIILNVYYKGIISYLNSFRILLQVRQQDLSRSIACTREARRLAIAARQLREWVDILGWTLHTPWSRDVGEPTRMATGPDASLLPTSIRLAEPSLPDDYAFQKASEIGAGALTGKGWRSAAFSRLVATATHAPDTTVLEHELDRIDSDDAFAAGPRALVQQALESGRPQAALLPEVLGRAADELRQHHLGTNDLTARLLTPDAADDAEVASVEFLEEALEHASPLAHETWSPAALISGEYRDLTTRVYQPASLDIASPPRYLVTRVDTSAQDRAALVDVVIRIDLTDAIEAGDLRLFSAVDDGPLVHPSPAEGVFT